MAFSLPLSQTLLKRLLLPQADLLRFMRAMAVGFFLAGTVVLIAFLAWLGSDATSRTLRVAVPDIQNAMQCVQVRESRHSCLVLCFCSHTRVPSPAPPRSSCGPAPWACCCGATCWRV
jgi:hypothetical protein